MFEKLAMEEDENMIRYTNNTSVMRRESLMGFYPEIFPVEEELNIC